MRIVLSACAIAIAWVLLFFRVGPVPTWFYVFAWYPTLVLLDAIAVRFGPERSLFADRRLTLAMFAWSPIVWLVFEAANFRLQNWYYVNLPAHGWERWTGIILSFATVVPALVLAERALRAVGVARRWRTRPIVIRAWELKAAVGLGLATGALALALPGTFFPLVWGAAFLLADPLVYRLTPRLSLLADVGRGDWSRIGRLLIGGLGIGIIWETYNFWAQGKWIYTVPWLEHTKFFEMPPFGLLGFPVFALEAWAMYAALCAVGAAIAVEGNGRFVLRRALGLGIAAVAVAAVTLRGMETRTISSTVPQLSDVPGLTDVDFAALRRQHIRSPFQLAQRDPAEVARVVGLDGEAAQRAVAFARLATLRGIGSAHTQTLARLGVHDLCTLAEQDELDLRQRIARETHAARPTRAEIRVWIRAAKPACSRSR